MGGGQYSRLGGRGSFPDERRVGVEVAADVAGEETCLEVDEQPDGGLLVEERMSENFLLAELIGGHHGLADAVALST